MERWVSRILTSALLLVWTGAAGCTDMAGTAYGVVRDERSVGTMMEDGKIAAEVKYRLIRDEGVKGLDLKAYCYAGRVFLVGEADTEWQKARAAEIAGETPGVRAVETYILDKPSEGSLERAAEDAKITATVKAKLIGDVKVSSTQIDVTTVQGRVVLLGVVGSSQAAARAVEHAGNTDGVAEVKSFLMVK